jgi:putative ABC transport system ATP-binding protein
MNTSTDVITLDSIRKIFQTDEVETHALSDVHLTIARGEYVSISGPDA